MDYSLECNLSFSYISLFGSCGAQQYFRPAPFIRWGPKAQAEEGYGSDTVMQVQHSIGIQPRTIQSSASPKSPRKKG